VQPAIRAERGAPLFEPPDARRRRIFSRWDEGIRTDEEGLYSATPEALALWLTQDAKGTVIDGTAGIGCIAIALARNPNVRNVIAVDLDRSRLEMAAHNADVYGVRSRIRFACDDVRSVLARERSDLLVLDPPWGGPNYDRNRVALPDLGMDVASVLERAPPWVKLKLPRSFDPTTLPGAFTFEAAVDSRGVVKFLVATRGRSETAG